ncbi:hypothetical protein QVD17_04606 [Tagetes erecta]|uniref:TPX2 C-terminal domain-containing protein n=1 Tax=Tagetes erecta TaxID=13708 RepID=A0AAD8P4M9_TARER|nr:hypothetical protein QVD17_04606 [Tagetes erecta]
MHSVSYQHTPSTPNYQIKMMQGSITSCEFMSDSLASEKWSNVCKKRYVEEAKSYTQPGSVAEKKAFFDAYYKKIAAQKAAAAALLEQEKEAAAVANAQDVTVKAIDLETGDNMEDANTKNIESLNIKNYEDNVSVCASQIDRSFLKLKLKGDKAVTQPTVKKKHAASSWVASIHHRKDNISTPRTKNVITNDYNDKRRLSPIPLKVLMNSSFVKQSCTKPTSRVCSTPTRSVTPVKTPAKAFANGVNKQPLATLSASRSSKSLTAYKSKLESPTTSSPFMLRTEDRAARRKQKLEEKFNEKQAQVVQQKAQFKEKAESEIRKMRGRLCFKALPLPEFYKGRETPEKIVEANPKLFTPRRTTPSTYSVKRMSSRRL